LLFAFAIPLAAQNNNTVKGKIYTGNQLAIPGASIKLENCITGIILAFTSSKEDGSFLLAKTTTADSFCITVSHISYVSKKIKISAAEKNIDFYLQKKKAVELPPVIIKSNPFIKSGDTLKFSVSGYDQANFRSIGDVIKNIPGIEVSHTGEISYNGKVISNYYIEGLDLLEERYSLANENLPKDMVAQVQILLRHQPIRILDSVNKGNNVALNLKLKEGAKNKLINNTTIATGFTNEKILYNLNLLSVLFSKKFQMLFANKANNTGEDLKQEIIGFRLSDFSNLNSVFIKEDLIQVVKPKTPPLSSVFFLNNHSVAPSANLLKKTGKYGELKLNLNYINQFSLLNNQVVTDFSLTNNQLLRIEENNQFTVKEQIFKAGVQYNYNGPKLYYKTETKFLSFGSMEKNSTTGSLTLEQMVKNPAQNFLQTISLIKTKKKIVFSGGLLFSYANLPQSLHTTPGMFPGILNSSVPYREFIQQINSSSLRSYQYFSATKKTKNLVHTIRLSGEWKDESLNRAVLKDSSAVITPIFINKNVTWKQLNIGALYEQRYQIGKFNYTVSLPVIFSKSYLLYETVRKKDKFFFNPTLSAGYNISEFTSINIELNRAEFFTNLINTVPFTFFQNYRVQREGLLSDFPVEKNAQLSLSYFYSNILKGFSFSVNLHSERTTQNFIPSLTYNGFLEKTILLSLLNKQLQKSFSLNLSQKIEAIKTNFQFRANFSSNQFSQFNQNISSSFSVLQPGVFIAANCKKIKNIVFDVSHRLSFNYFKNTGKAYSLNGKANVTEALFNFFLLKEKLIISTQQKVYNNRGLNNKNEFFQTDFKIRYRYKKTDFQISCTNLLNDKLYSEYQTFGNIQSWNQYILVGRQIVLSYSFVF
jgi:hypothetical protein